MNRLSAYALSLAAAVALLEPENEAECSDDDGEREQAGHDVIRLGLHEIPSAQAQCRARRPRLP